MYLTYEEYNEMPFERVEKEDFDRLSKLASDALDGVTRDFYQRHDLEADTAWRKQKFKKAVGAQIEYMECSGNITSADADANVKSVAIGRTTITKGDSNQSVICGTAMRYLSGTGLLNRGCG